MLQHGYCPRGPFCAFAHNENEMKQDREAALRNYGTLAHSPPQNSPMSIGSMPTSVFAATGAPGRFRRSSESVVVGAQPITNAATVMFAEEQALFGAFGGGGASTEFPFAFGAAVPVGSPAGPLAASRLRKYSPNAGGQTSPSVAVRANATEQQQGSPSYSVF